jgi:TonB family protein
MRLRSIVLALACATILAAPADARSVRRLQPAGKWVVEYANDTCRLGREFGEGNQSVIVFFEQFVPGEIFYLMFVGRSIVPSRLDPIKSGIRFGPNEAFDEDNFGTRATVGSLPALMLGDWRRLAPLTEPEKLARKEAEKRDYPYQPSPIGPARERAATWLELGKALSFDLVLETGPMDKPLEALRQCTWDLVKSWGLSIEEQKGLTRKAYPIIPSGKWFSSDDYPIEMLSQGYEGNVNIRVIVDAAGTPVSCHVQSSTRPQGFDDIVCRQVMKKGRFHPALDASGKPIKSYWRQSVSFRIGW